MMSKSFYPCIWFDNNAGEAADFYCSIFGNATMLQQNPIVTTFSLNGTMFMGLNGGPKYKPNGAFSYYVYCASVQEVNKLYEALTQNGNILMPSGKYDWSEQYAWVIDKFGVNWQLDIANINSTQKIVPTLLFANKKMTLVKDAVSHYTTIFKGATVLLESPYAASANFKEGTLLFAQVKLNSFILNAMSSTLQHEFDFGVGNSLVVECQSQQEIDYYWDMLGDGGHYDMCGWLVDKFGVSWQIVPAILSKLMSDGEKGQRVIQAFLNMQKFDIEKLLNA